MAKSPNDKVGSVKEVAIAFVKGLFGAFTELPTQTKLAGFFQLAFLGVLWLLHPTLD